MKLDVLRIYFQLVVILFFASCAQIGPDKEYLKLKQEIEKGLDEEQAIRKRVHENMLRDTFDLDLNNKMGVIDSLNLIKAKAFLTAYGYPSISKDGKKLSDGIFNILQHNDVATMEKYIGQLKEKALKGEASKKQYALMQDRILVENNLKQLYGTQSAPRKNANGFITNQYYVWPIQDVKKVDSLRKEMGFKKTVEEYANDLDIEYNKDESIPLKN